MLFESLVPQRGKIILSRKSIQGAVYTFIILGNFGIKLLWYVKWETFLSGIVLNGFHCIFRDVLHILEIVDLVIDMSFESLYILLTVQAEGSYSWPKCTRVGPLLIHTSGTYCGCITWYTLWP